MNAMIYNGRLYSCEVNPPLPEQVNNRVELTTGVYHYRGMDGLAMVTAMDHCQRNAAPEEVEQMFDQMFATLTGRADVVCSRQTL